MLTAIKTTGTGPANHIVLDESLTDRRAESEILLAIEIAIDYY